MKIQANELRIGNYIGRDGDVLIVEALSEDDIRCSVIEKTQGQHVNSGNKYYLPLNRDWFLKLGFENKANQFRLKDRLIVCREGFFYDYGTGTKLEYVHQLQNLIFVLNKC